MSILTKICTKKKKNVLSVSSAHVFLMEGKLSCHKRFLPWKKRKKKKERGKKKEKNLDILSNILKDRYVFKQTVVCFVCIVNFI